MPHRITTARLSVLLTAAALGLGVPRTAAAQDLQVHAAVSLAEVLDELVEEWEAETGLDVLITYGPSSALARRIGEGAQADIFLSANEGWMDHVAALGLLDNSSRRDLATNRLALAATGDPGDPGTIGPDFDLVGLLGVGRLSIPHPDSEAAGLYGKAALVSLGLWDSVAPHLLETADVRQSLAAVLQGDARAAIVFVTDVAAAPGLRVLGLFPADSHPRIVYSGAVLPEGNAAVAGEFLDMLSGPVARAAFASHGFGTVQ